MQRFLQGRQSSALRESINHQIETCGESMSKVLNERARGLFQQHIDSLMSQAPEFVTRMKKINKKHESGF
jgi:hypothetical protein